MLSANAETILRRMPSIELDVRFVVLLSMCIIDSPCAEMNSFILPCPISPFLCFRLDHPTIRVSEAQAMKLAPFKYRYDTPSNVYRS